METRSHAEIQLKGRLGNACFRFPVNSLGGHLGGGVGGEAIFLLDRN